MNSKTKEIFQSFILIAIFNFLWVFIHSYINTYLLFSPIYTGAQQDLPRSFFLWNSYADLIVRVGKYGFINTISMFIGIVIIIKNKNSNYTFQSIITGLLFVLNLLFTVIFLPLFKKWNIDISITNMLLYTVYYLVPWILYLLFFNKYYVRGLGHLLKYFSIALFLFILIFIIRNNNIMYKQTAWLSEKNQKKREEFAKSLENEKMNKERTQGDIKKAPKGFTGIKQKYPKIHIYPFKTGIITYNISGKQKGEQTMSFDHYGLRELTISETYKDTFKIKKMLLLDNKYVYAIDLNHNIGNVAKSGLTEEIKEGYRYNKILSIKMGNLKLHQRGRQYFKGKNCTVWVSDNGDTKVWTWMGLILKKVLYQNSLPVSTLEAKEIKTDVAISSEKFLLPPGITFIRYHK